MKTYQVDENGYYGEFGGAYVPEILHQCVENLQKKYLEDYAVQHGFDNIQHFSDDGYSGTNFNRPAFNSLLTEIEADRVGTVIVKDMSRFGRNYLQVGFYTEMMFPKKNVRFIAVNNGVDSANPADNDFTPFLNI